MGTPDDRHTQSYVPAPPAPQVPATKEQPTEPRRLLRAQLCVPCDTRRDMSINGVHWHADLLPLLL